MFFIKLLLFGIFWLFSYYKLFILLLFSPLINYTFNNCVSNNYWIDNDNLYFNILGSLIWYINFIYIKLLDVYNNNKNNIIISNIDKCIVKLNNFNNLLFFMISLFRLSKKSYNPKIIPVNIDNFELTINLLDKIIKSKIDYELKEESKKIYKILTKDLKNHFLYTKKDNNLFKLIKSQLDDSYEVINSN